MGTLVSHKLRYCTGAWTSKALTWSAGSSVIQNTSLHSDLTLNMSCKLAHCIVLVMKPSWYHNGPEHEPEDHRNSNNELLRKIELKLLQLQGMDNAELVSVKAALRRAAEQFKDVTGRTRRFVLSFKKHDSAHRNHVALEVGSGLIHLLKWIVQDQLELASLNYLVPHKHLCGNCKSGLIPRNHLLV